MTIARPVLCLCLLAALAAPALAEPRISNLEMILDGQRILLSFNLEDAIDERFVERIESGLPTEFVYRFQLVRGNRIWRKIWFDRKVDSNSLQVLAMYDAVRQEYLINYKLAGKLVRSRMVRDLEELKWAMTHFENEPLLSLEGAQEGWRMWVRVRAELGAKTILLLIPSRITTDWVDSERFSLPAAAP